MSDRAGAFASSQVIFTEKKSPARAIHFGESFLEESLPVGTRVIYSKPPMTAVPLPKEAIRHALNHPVGECEPLFAQLRPGMRVTIALDDISLPLPSMTRPDIRQMILEEVLTTLHHCGVDDVHIIIARSFHRRMKPWEIRHAVGDEIFQMYYPKRLYDHDGEDHENMVVLGTTEHGEHAHINRRAAESDLLIYVNINLVPMDGGHKSVGVGLSGYKGLRAHHNAQTIRKTSTYMDPENSAMHQSTNRVGRIVEEHIKIFHIETAVNTQMYQPPLSFLARPEETWSTADHAKFRAMKWTLDRLPFALKRKALFSHYAPYGMIAVAAGTADAVHEKILEASWKQYLVPVQGQADILISGIPFVSPYNVNSIMNPLLVQVMGLGYFFNMFKGKTPLIRKGGTMILCHPCYDAFDPEQHPSYMEFFNRLLPETRDASVLQEKYEKEFARNPAYIQMYRHGYAYHGVHPFYMWYWGENGRQHVGRVIVVGAENSLVPERLGWETAPNMTAAIEMAKDGMKHSPQITYLHHPPIVITEVQ